MRSNIDPFGDYDDERLHEAMRSARLIPSYSLDSPIDADGSNLSVGTRALVSLARALVKRATILCLDEATGNVDAATDAFVQRTIACI